MIIIFEPTVMHHAALWFMAVKRFAAVRELNGCVGTNREVYSFFLLVVGFDSCCECLSGLSIGFGIHRNVPCWWGRSCNIAMQLANSEAACAIVTSMSEPWMWYRRKHGIALQFHVGAHMQLHKEPRKRYRRERIIKGPCHVCACAQSFFHDLAFEMGGGTALTNIFGQVFHEVARICGEKNIATWCG